MRKTGCFHTSFLFSELEGKLGLGELPPLPRGLGGAGWPRSEGEQEAKEEAKEEEEEVASDHAERKERGGREDVAPGGAGGDGAGPAEGGAAAASSQPAFQAEFGAVCCCST